MTQPSQILMHGRTDASTVNKNVTAISITMQAGSINVSTAKSHSMSHERLLLDASKPSANVQHGILMAMAKHTYNC